MNLPEGIRYNPSQFERLIAITAKAGEGLITIDPALGYTVNDRDFKKNFQDLFSEDYREFARRYHLIEQSPVYSGAEHKGDPKLPNITVLPNIPTRRARTMQLRFDQKTFGIGRDLDLRMPTGQEVTLFGCTMGHWHGQTDCPDGVQEVYEFQSYGALVIDWPESDEVELWVARDGDKVAVPQQCHMTLYNLDDLDHPLVTLDFANPKRNYANKELVGRIGPILLAYYTPYEAVFILNRHYINRERIYVRPDEFINPQSQPSGEVNNQNCLNGGVRLPGPLPGREVRIPLGARASLGQQLYEALTGDAEVIIQFARLGIRVCKASPEVELGGVRYGRPLAEAVRMGKANQLYRFFFSNSSGNPKAKPGDDEEIPEPKRPLHEGEKEWLKKGPRFLEPGREPEEPAQRDISIMIEGAGDWVDKAFIPSIEKAREELAVRRQRQPNLPDLSVIIADDSRWHSPGKKPPVKPDPEIYRNLRRAIDCGLNCLFSIQWTEVGADLQNVGNAPSPVPDLLLQKFSAQNITLPNTATIRRTQENEWRIDNYTLLREGETIKVCKIAGQEIIKPQPVLFLDKADPSHLRRYERMRPNVGIVFIVTPDYTHSTLCRAHLDRAPTIFVEKPFDANWENVRALLEARGRAALDTEIYALDHYRFYSWRLKETNPKSGKSLLEEATDWLGGALREARFCMMETGPVEPHRIRALQFGLMLDMLPHCFGMLAFFGRLDSVDEFEVLEVGRYEGAPIPNETYAHVRFTFEDYSDNGWRVPCEAWLGKGLRISRKYFEVVGKSGRSVLIALGKTTWQCRQTRRDQSIDGGIYFVDENGNLNPQAPLDPDRYKQLFVDLITGELKAIVCAMPLVDGEQIVHALDRFWNATQAHSPWRPYKFGELDCFN
jgi:predicted dehydrogenase